MRRWKVCSSLILVLAFGALGCGSSTSPTAISLSISPVQQSVITNTTLQFVFAVTGSSNQSVTWALACATVTNATVTNCGSIDSTNGLYTAPATIPTATISGTVTPEPTVTITATPAADTSKTATATLTIITGIRISITPVGAVIGTGEHFNFAATVNNPGCNITSNPNCLNVTWSVPTSTTTSNFGSIDSNGTYTAPATAPSPGSVTITATSVADTSVTATATVTVETASDPTVTFVSPSNAGLGSLFQDIYITGTNFLSTSIVYVNGSLLDPSEVSADSTSVIRARIPANLLASVPPSGILAITVSRQIGAPQSCADPSKCQVVVSDVRPVIVGPSPDSIPQSQSSSSVQTFNVNGGFFGTASNPSVSATYDGQPRVAQVTESTTRQLSVSIGGNANSQDFSLAGLHQITIRSNGDPTKFASANLAVQPDVNANPPTPIGAPLPVGTTPNSVAINPATGMAVVANTGTNDVTLIDMSATTPSVLMASLCTGALGAASAPCTTASGPQGVAVAHMINPAKNIALVANTAAKTISEIDLDAKSVIWVSPTLQDPPVAVGINPVTGRALVAMNSKSYGLLIDLTQTTPTILGPVSITTGGNAHIAVEPHLNWALATPGGAGTVSIVDLNRQTTNNITNISRTSNVVTVTVQASTSAVPQSPLGVEFTPDPDTVQIQGIGDNSFNGIYQISSVGPGPNTFSYTQTGSTLPDVATFTTSGTVNYSKPVARLTVGSTAVQGVDIDPETETAILTDPSPTGAIIFFSLIDQSVIPLTFTNSSGGVERGTASGAFNPLTNTAFVVNSNTSTLSVVDPTTPKRLPSPNTTFATGQTPVAVAVDPASNRLIVVNQADNNVWVYSLGSANTVRPIAITQINPKTFTASSTLTTGPSPAALTLSVIGKGLTCISNTTTLTVRLDGVPLSTACATSSGDRGLTAIVPPSLLLHARRFTVDVLDSVSGTVSNASDFTVEQSIDVTGCSASPFPSGVAIDAQQNIAAVTLAGCNSLALISLSNGTGQTVSVGPNPQGVAVIPRLHVAVVANNGGNSASIVDELGASVVNTVATDSGSLGVAADQDTGKAAVANSVANSVTVINVTGGGTSSISADQRPVAVGFNYANHQIAVAADSNNGAGGVVSFADATSGSVSNSVVLGLPTSVVYDPVTGDVGNDCGTATNKVGCFLVNSSIGNTVTAVDPITQFQASFRIGINPTAIAYNYLASTIVSTNTISHTVTVGDFLDKRIRAVLTLPAAPPNSIVDQQGVLQFAVDIQPLTNLAVIADTANGRVLLVPIPR
jgi:DNA-binding beta-propeller fold protein YncE